MEAESSIAVARMPPASALQLRSERANRAVNIILATVALLVLSPLLILIAVATKLSSRGPILYTQIRVGVDHRFAK